jgi:Na+/phosphate symporter
MPKRDRLPEMVYKTLITPGFLENIYPALKVVMGTNIGNTAWTSGIAITFAFFGIIQTLPYVLEIEKNGG